MTGIWVRVSLVHVFKIGGALRTARRSRTFFLKRFRFLRVWRDFASIKSRSRIHQNSRLTPRSRVPGASRMAQQLRIQGRFGYRHIQLIKTKDYSLGIGSYGAVYRAKCENLPCAAKVLHPILFETRDPAAYRIVQRFEQECEFLSGMRHPNIIQHLGTCRDPESGLPILFMELMDESLTSFLERLEDPPPLPLHIQVNIAYDVTQALAYLHCHEILHRDLSSNNVLMIGSSRAKVTDFGMAKLVANHPRRTPTYCPGTQGYMSPEAMGDPPVYTTKLDIFSCGVLFVQIITRKFPNPGPRMNTVELNDPRVPSGRVLVEVPELERRKAHLDLTDPAHPLLRIALDCLKDKDGQRPTAEQLCSHLTALKESPGYQESLQWAPGDTASPTPRARDGELEQRLRERVEDLTHQVQQLQLQSGRQNEEKDSIIQQKEGENQRLRQQLQTTSRDSEQLVAALQQSLEKKDRTMRAKDDLLQEEKRQIRELQRGKEGSGVATGPLKLEWKDGPKATCPTYGNSVAVSGGVAYFRDGLSDTTVQMYSSEKEQWTVLPECSKRYFSIAVVNGLLTAIGGKQAGRATKTLVSFTHQQTWTEKFPPMTYCHNNPAIVCTSTSLIVAGGWNESGKINKVEVMDAKTLRWSTAASLPHALSVATATICGSRMYIAGGTTGTCMWTKSVFMCKVRDLLQSTTQPQTLLAGLRVGLSRPQFPAVRQASGVWRAVAELPVIQSSLVTLRGQLLAIGGSTDVSGSGGETSDVRQYDAATDSWNVISHMNTERQYFFAAVLPNDRIIVVGGEGYLDSVEIASVL